MKRAVLLLALVACSAPTPPAFAPCSIRERHCRVDTLLALETERGQLWDPWTEPPSVVVIDVTELDRRLRLTASLTWNSWIEPLGALGLLDPDMSVPGADIRWMVDNTAAVYWPHDKEVSIVNRGLPLDDVDATATLAHEYTHAAQDQEFGMKFEEGRLTTDRELVRKTLIEGEADLYGTVATLRMQGTDPAAFDWAQHYAAQLASVREQTPLSDAPHTLIRNALPYPAGGLLMARAWLQGRSTAVNQILLSPPASFGDIMRALEGRPRAEPPSPLCHRPALPADRFQLFDTDRLGAGLFYAYLTRGFGLEAEAWQAALTWRSDQIWSYRDAVNAVPFTFWRIRTAGLRETTIGQMLAARTEPPLLVGDEVLFWSGIDAATAELVKQASCAP